MVHVGLFVSFRQDSTEEVFRKLSLLDDSNGHLVSTLDLWCGEPGYSVNLFLSHGIAKL